MSKNDQVILVIENKLLFENEYFQGFQSKDLISYEQRILKNYSWMKRGIAEQNTTHKQPIVYSLIVNASIKKVFAFQRSNNDANYKEKRLQGKWSWGIGGHIEKCDTSDNNPIYQSLLRELSEEVKCEGSLNPQILGYINDDTNDVGKVHFGMLYIVETSAIDVKPEDSEIAFGNLMSIEEIENIMENYDVETWSQIAYKPLLNYFKSL